MYNVHHINSSFIENKCKLFYSHLRVLNFFQKSHPQEIKGVKLFYQCFQETSLRSWIVVL